MGRRIGICFFTTTTVNEMEGTFIFLVFVESLIYSLDKNGSLRLLMVVDLGFEASHLTRKRNFPTFMSVASICNFYNHTIL